MGMLLYTKQQSSPLFTRCHRSRSTFDLIYTRLPFKCNHQRICGLNQVSFCFLDQCLNHYIQQNRFLKRCRKKCLLITELEPQTRLLQFSLISHLMANQRCKCSSQKRNPSLGRSIDASLVTFYFIFLLAHSTTGKVGGSPKLERFCLGKRWIFIVLHGSPANSWKDISLRNANILTVGLRRSPK